MNIEIANEHKLVGSSGSKGARGMRQIHQEKLIRRGRRRTVYVENSESIRGKLESYERAFKRFESMARRIKNYSRFTDQEGRDATRNFWRLGGGSYSREAVQGVAGWFGIRNVGVYSTSLSLADPSLRLAY